MGEHESGGVGDFGLVRPDPGRAVAPDAPARRSVQRHPGEAAQLPENAKAAAHAGGQGPHPGSSAGGPGSDADVGFGPGPELAAALAEVAPRVRVEWGSGRVWVDARGLPAPDLVEDLLQALACAGVRDARAGVADVAVAAWAAASGLRAPAPADALAGAEPGRRVADGETARGRDGGTPAFSGFAGSVASPVAAGVAGAPTRLDSPSRRLALPPSASCFFVPPGEERAFLETLPLTLLEAEGADPQVLAMLEGVGVSTCGQLAALEREAVEVRCGAEGVRLWRLARADDARMLFRPIPPELPQASLDFVDYVVSDPERLAFTVNALLGSICDALRESGEHARRLRLVLELASGDRWEQGLRPGRPTASRAVWLRLARGALDRAALPDAVAGVQLQVEATEPAAVRQGDLFDAGFATAPAVEAAVLRLLESQGEVVVRPEADGHPLAERRVRWRPVPVDEVVSATTPAESASGRVGEWATGATSVRRRVWAARPPQDRRKAVSHSPPPPLPHSEDQEEEGAALSLQLLDVPREIRVETVPRHDLEVPARYRELTGAAERRGPGAGALAGGPNWHAIVDVTGPDRVSGGMWADPYAREYFRALTEDGALVWLFRDARTERWYLHGWWD